MSAIPNAAPDQHTRPLIVLSHGYGGNWRNLSWLAGELAARGYSAAAPDHPGTTTFNRNPAQAAMLWERPRDLSRVIDALLANPALGRDLRDPRIKAAVSLDLGLARGFSPESLALESGWLTIPDAMHFTFLQVCKPGTVALLEAEEPGLAVICRDAGSRGREAIHGEILSRITEFLTPILER